ncbi:MAG TPA: 2-C-methyl-D-erythritol 4-phosphate cytidylyltransferase [Bacillota bacterium]|nr:2-C-methyl-D-erythritol 4-phosphate cytidylyltransferase [Bacillota bacterium]
MNNEFQAVAIIPAAGSGRRMGSEINKIWLPIDGKSIVTYTLEVFLDSPWVDQIILVVNPVELAEFENFLKANFHPPSKEVILIPGGVERRDSVSNALNFLKNWQGWRVPKRLVAIHDAARALITPELIDASIKAGLEHGAAGVGVPVKDTIKKVDDFCFIEQTPERSKLWAIQTPQVFDFQLITACYEATADLNIRFSDDCSVAEYCGRRVKMIPGSYENFKITTPEDLVLAEILLRRRKNANRAGN